jgi:hypothetical protein
LISQAHIDPAPFVLTTRSGEFIVATQTNKLCIYSNMKGVAQVKIYFEFSLFVFIDNLKDGLSMYTSSI